MKGWDVAGIGQKEKLVVAVVYHFHCLVYCMNNLRIYSLVV